MLVQGYPDLQLMILFGQGKQSSVYDVRKIHEFLGPAKCRVIPFFVALTGCDTTSQFAGKGKLSAWNAWLAYPLATDAFLIQPFGKITIDSERFQMIETFICILYNRTTSIKSVNEMSEALFTTVEFMNLPPTQDALYQHVLRAVYQASIWLLCMEVLINAPNPAQYGWIKVGDRYVPLWTYYYLQFLLNVELFWNVVARLSHFVRRTAGARKFGSFHVRLFASAKANVKLLEIGYIFLVIHHYCFINFRPIISVPWSVFIIVL